MHHEVEHLGYESETEKERKHQERAEKRANKEARKVKEKETVAKDEGASAKTRSVRKKTHKK